MQKIDTPDGRFHDGNPATGELGTILSAWWLDGIQGEVASVIEAAGLTLDRAKSDQLLSALRALTLYKLKAGHPLPTTDVGPIWHDDYNSIMTWQVFNANGAAYAGYASVLVGSLLLDTQPTPRAGYIKSGVTNLSRTAYAALRGWAMHNGLMVAAGVWQAGDIAVADNADGLTFRVYDVRGEFPRIWDDGRGVDLGRAFGAWQNGTHISGDDGLVPGVHGVGNMSQINADPGDGAARTFYYTHSGVAAQTDAVYWRRMRPRNAALLAAIKF